MMEVELDFINNSNLKWLKDNTIFLTVVGSQSYGLATKNSDTDFKGLAVPPLEYFTGFTKKFEQAEFKAPQPDCCIFNLVKWISLAVDNNPSVIEILWTDPKWYVIASKYWDRIIEHRSKILSRNVRYRFGGYATAQLKKMVRHFRFMRNPPKGQPKRPDFGLPEHFVIPKNQLDAALSLVEKKLDSWNPNLNTVDNSERIEIMNNITDIMVELVGASLYLEKDKLWNLAAKSIGLDSNFVELIVKEKEYKAKMAEWKSFCEWKKNRNPKRRELEERVGYDSKDACALIRLLRMAKEILTTGEVIVTRPDREELLEIKNGFWEYEKIIEYAQNADKELDVLYETSPLPYSPDREFFDKLCREIVEEFLEINTSNRVYT